MGGLIRVLGFSNFYNFSNKMFKKSLQNKDQTKIKKN